MSDRSSSSVESIDDEASDYVAKEHSERFCTSHFLLLKLLGEGSFGKVFLVQKTTGHNKGDLFAMKVLKKVTVKRKLSGVCNIYSFCF